MLLGELLKRIEYIECKNFIECEIAGVGEHSSAISEGFVFVCVKGYKNDGFDYLNDAKVRGARAFVTDRKDVDLSEENVIIVENARKSIAEISNALYGEKLSEIKIIGVTGTKGKTTTAKILSECISFMGLKCVCIGTLGVEYYEDKSRVHLRGKCDNTTPSAPFLYKALSDAYLKGVRVAVLEVSSQALMSYRVYGIPFTVCVFTNFSPDHVGNFEHASLGEYFEAKRKLFSDYGSKISVVNSDDECSELISNGIEHVVYVGKDSKSFRVGILFSCESYSEFKINDTDFHLSLGGRFNVMNASLAVVTASLISGRNISEFSNVLNRISVDGRYEVYRIKDKTVIIDFAHNMDSFRSVLESVNERKTGRIISLFGSVGNRSLKRRGELASVAENLSDYIVITSDNPCNEPAEKICKDIYNAIKDKTKAKIITDRKEAIAYAIDLAKPKDIVLLLGKGHEAYQLIGNDKIPFSEREIIESLGAVRIF